ncbi:toxic anion resistance protein [Sphingomonas sp. BAUL-RG-20F-R05-02]|uniref:toxic anion resistance protein n=1 Tax=Sphingomonas sp. BAUL-RG-20F-R05-02 TaxID=2914830 RepID=UPI001F59AA99|nr:toxic anion resistance protein [Sphingomonas sp. BAUL-RG-20F-R05-02]
MTDLPVSQSDARAEARLALRQWLAADDATVLARVDALGRQAIAAAADASARLDRGVTASRSAQASLSALQALIARVDAPPPQPSFFRRRVQAEPPIDIATLVETLDRERDAVALSLIGLDTDLKRLSAAAAGLDGALALVRACGGAVEAAARELAIDSPERAQFLREAVAERLLAREQDLLTQAAVTQQGVLTLGLIAESQRALADTLARARDTSVAALRTAIAARQAIAGSQRLAEQTAALDRTVDAARAAGGDARDVRRILDDALAQAQAAIAAAEAGRSPGSR